MIQDRSLEETFHWGWNTNGFTSDEHIIDSEYLLIFASLLCCSLLVQHYVGHVFKWQYLPEAAATMMVGMVISLIIRFSGGYNNNHSESTYFDTTLLGFSPKIFFFGFLPPIVFNSGYHLKRKLFFDNFAGIFSLAVLGTFISITITATAIFLLSTQTNLLPSASSFTLIESIAFASLISSTDPVGTLAVFQSLRVEPTLFYLVFGESLLNDAISITIFKVTSRFIGHKMYSSEILFCFVNFWISFIGSCFIGYSMGIMIALIYKYVDFRDHRLSAVSLFVSTVYIPFFLAEVLQLSGIVTILFCGIASRRYINKNLPSNARQNASFVFQLLAYLAETSCFCLLGLSAFSQSFEYFRFDMILVTLTLLVLSRAMHVYPLLSLVNYYRSRRDSTSQSEIKENSAEEVDVGYKNLKIDTDIEEKSPSSSSSKEITWAQMHMIMFSGLRGAVAFSLANIFPDTNSNKKLVIATTAAIIIITIFIGGGLTTTVMKMLKIKTGVDHTLSAREIKENMESFEKKFAYPFVLRTGYRNIIPTSKGCSSGGGYDFDSPNFPKRRIPNSKGGSSGGGSDFYSPDFLKSAITPSTFSNTWLRAHTEQDYESSTSSLAESILGRSRITNDEIGTIRKGSTDNNIEDTNKKLSLDIEEKEMNDIFRLESKQSHNKKKSSEIHFYSEVVSNVR